MEELRGYILGLYKSFILVKAIFPALAVLGLLT